MLTAEERDISGEQHKKKEHKKRDGPRKKAPSYKRPDGLTEVEAALRKQERIKDEISGYFEENFQVHMHDEQLTWAEETRSNEDILVDYLTANNGVFQPGSEA